MAKQNKPLEPYQKNYATRVTRLADMLGGLRALSRNLGLGHSTLTARIENPCRVKREMSLALEMLETRLEIN